MNPLLLIGLLPGKGRALSEQVRFTDGLHHTSLPHEAVVENFLWHYRAYLHEQLLPVAFIDEVGRLTDSAGSMVRSIKESQQALTNINLTLEQRVRERTEELAQAKETFDSAKEAAEEAKEAADS